MTPIAPVREATATGPTMPVDRREARATMKAVAVFPGQPDFLITGHESLGRVEEVGPSVRELQPGDHVVASVRRPGSSLYDTIGLQDMTTDDTYFERGINLRHGYLAEYYADAEDFLIKVPCRLTKVGVLLEPTSVAAKAIGQAYEIQRRLRVWRPHRAAVLGSGTLGLLTSLLLRLRGLQVVTFGLTPPPFLNSQLLSTAELAYPGWLAKLLTHPVKGLERYQELLRTLTEAKDAIKVYCEVSPID
jgi:threonine dehydrogenase-like Zn-dependent dehydrogenase